MGLCLATEAFAAAIIPSVALSTWLIVLALGRIEPLTFPIPLLVATEFFRTLPEAVPAVLLVLSRLPVRGREDGVVVMCNFC